MARLVVTQFITLDGVTEAPGGEPTHPHSGWVGDYMGPEEAQFKLEEALEAESHLLGRVTYESFAGAWPQREGEFAEKINTMPKYVVSSTLAEPFEWENSHLIAGGGPRRPDPGAEGGRGSPDPRRRQRHPGRIVDRKRARRRAAADGLPGDDRRRPAPFPRGPSASIPSGWPPAGHSTRASSSTPTSPPDPAGRRTATAGRGLCQPVVMSVTRTADEAAFRRLIEPHRAELHAHCYRMLGSVHDAEDALQEAFLRAWRGLDQFEGRSSLRSWLYRIATNTCLDAIARRPKRVLPAEYPAADPARGDRRAAGRVDLDRALRR